MNAQWLELVYSLDAEQAELLYDTLADLLNQIWEVHGMAMIDQQIERDEVEDLQDAVDAAFNDKVSF